LAYESFFGEVCAAVVENKNIGNDNDAGESEDNSEDEKKESIKEEIAVEDDLSKYNVQDSKYIGKSVFGSGNLGNTCFFNSAM